MTLDEVLGAFRVAGMDAVYLDAVRVAYWAGQAFEREACAKICDGVDSYSNPLTANDVAHAIRARGDKL